MTKRTEHERGDAEFLYTPDAEQKVHGTGAIALICKPFQSHEHGLPEWAKNGADAYGREDIEPARRVIVLLFCDRAALGPPSIGCLDFVGTTSGRIEEYFRHWASPDAATQDTGFKVQGGHGNGGKCYMTQMFTEHSIFSTVRSGKGCRYGVRGGTVQFGYVPDVPEGRDYDVPDLRKELNTRLRPFGAKLSQMPKPAIEALDAGDGFTLIGGVGPKHYDRKIRVADLISKVRDHTQMLTTLEYCSVYVLYNGKLLEDCCPLRPAPVNPIPGVEAPRMIDIPKTLKDPTDGSQHPTVSDDCPAPGRLALLTSNTSMRYRKKSRHTINYKSSGGFIGWKSMLGFPVQSGYRDKIYGWCELEALDQYKQNSRGPLAEAPLTRAVENFIAEQIEEYCQEFEQREKKDYTKKERNALSQMNEALDRWKNEFIKNFMAGAFGPGGGPIVGGNLPAGKPSRIEVIATNSRLGIGVAIRPRVRFYDASGKQIRPVPYRWVSEDNDVAMVDDDLMLINSFSHGDTIIYAETLDGKLQSNRVPLQVVRILSISIEPGEAEVKTGSRTQLRAICRLSTGETTDDIALIWTEGNASIARVSASGTVFGASVGQTDVAAGDDHVVSKATAIITVVEGDGTGKGKGKGGKGSGKQIGQGYPLILVSGEVDCDPETDEYVHLSADHPPVYQRPIDSDRNIWWINSASPLASMYLSKDLDYGYQSREWRMYHLERYVDIIAEIAMTYDPQLDGPNTVSEYSLNRAAKVTEIHAAIASELTDFINEGAVPEL